MTQTGDIMFRPAEDRGHTRIGWLDSRHSFSFGHYYDPAHMGFGPLRVINEDRVIPGAGFGTHGHANMEIISYVLGGALEHKDSLGTGSVIRPGDVQRMSAGTGIRHSEFNASTDDSVHFLQIWIMPEEEGLTPGYEQIHVSREQRTDQWRLIGSRAGREGSVTIHQDVDLWASLPGEGKTIAHTLRPGRIAWLHVVKGLITFAGRTLKPGDAVGVREAGEIALTGASDEAEVLLFDMTP